MATFEGNIISKKSFKKVLHCFSNADNINLVLKRRASTLQCYLYPGGLAQLGEHLPYKQGVGGSSPSSSTISKTPV